MVSFAIQYQSTEGNLAVLASPLSRKATGKIPKFILGYDVKIQNPSAPVSKATVFQHAETLLSDIAIESKNEFPKPILFVAHSLGGIVVKEAISLSKASTGHLHRMYQATAGVCFLGTPHRGSIIANLGRIGYGLKQVLTLRPSNIRILELLQSHSEMLDRISKDFVEELPTKGMMVVDSVSSALGIPQETHCTIHSNHREMVKYRALEDPGFVRLSGVLRGWVESVKRKSRRKRPEPASQQVPPSAVTSSTGASGTTFLAANERRHAYLNGERDEHLIEGRVIESRSEIYQILTAVSLPQQP